MNISLCVHSRNKFLCLRITVGTFISVIGVALIATHASALYQGIGYGSLGIGGIVILASLIHTCCQNKKGQNQTSFSAAISLKPPTQVSFTRDDTGASSMPPSLSSLCDHLAPELCFPKPLPLSASIKREPPVLTRPLDPEVAQWTLGTIVSWDPFLFLGGDEETRSFWFGYHDEALISREAFATKECTIENLKVFLPDENALAWLALKYQNSYQISLSVIHLEDLEAQLKHEQANSGINAYFGLFVIDNYSEKLSGVPLLFYQTSPYKLQCYILGNDYHHDTINSIECTVKIFDCVVEWGTIDQGFPSHTTSLFTLLAHALIDLKVHQRHGLRGFKIRQDTSQVLKFLDAPFDIVRLPSAWTFGQESTRPDINPEMSLSILPQLTRRQLYAKYEKIISCIARSDCKLKSYISTDQSKFLGKFYRDFNKKITIPLPQGMQLSWNEKDRTATLLFIYSRCINTYSYDLAKAHFEIFFNEKYQSIISSQTPLLGPMCRLITHYLHDPIPRRL